MNVKKIENGFMFNGINIPEEIVIESVKNYYEKDKIIQTVNFTNNKKFITDYEYNDNDRVIKATSYESQEKILKKSDIIVTEMNTEYDDKGRPVKIYSEQSGYCKEYKYESSGWWEIITSGSVEEKYHYDNSGKTIYYHNKVDGQIVNKFNMRKSKNRIHTTEEDYVGRTTEKISYIDAGDKGWLIIRSSVKNPTGSVEKEFKYDSLWNEISCTTTEKNFHKGTTKKVKMNYIYDIEGRLVEFISSNNSENGKVTYMEDYTVTEIFNNGNLIQTQRCSKDKKKLITIFNNECAGTIVYTNKDDDKKKSYNIVYMDGTVVQAFFSYKEFTYSLKIMDGSYILSVTEYKSSKSDSIKRAYTIKTSDMVYYNEIVKLIAQATMVKLGSDMI